MAYGLGYGLLYGLGYGLGYGLRYELGLCLGDKKSGYNNLSYLIERNLYYQLPIEEML